MISFSLNFEVIFANEIVQKENTTGYAKLNIAITKITTKKKNQQKNHNVLKSEISRADFMTPMK